MTDTNETEMTDRDVLVTIAAMFLKDGGMRLNVVEMLERLGRADIIEEARIVNETDDDEDESDPEPEDELDESSDE